MDNIFADFSKGKIPLQYNIYKDKERRLKLREVIPRVAIIVLTIVIVPFFGDSLGVIWSCVCLIPFFVAIFMENEKIGLVKTGYVEFRDDQIIISNEGEETTIPGAELRSVSLMIRSTQGRFNHPRTHALTLFTKTGKEYKLHADASAYMEEHPKYFHTWPPDLFTTVLTAKKVFKIRIDLDKKLINLYL